MEKNFLLSKLQKQRNLRKNQSTEERVEAANEQILILRDQKEALESTLKDLKFEIDEIKCSKTEKSEQNQGNKDSLSRGLFFKLLSQLEDEENELKEKILMQKKALSDLTHQRNVILQQNKKIESEVSLKKELSYNAEMNARASRDKLLDLQDVLSQKEREYTSLCEQSESINNELVAKTDDIEQNNKNVVENLKKKKIELIVELQTKENEEKEMKNKAKDTERLCEAKKKRQEEDIQRSQSVNEWRSQRKFLTSKLVASRKKLSAELKNLESARKKESELQEKFKKLLGEDDPGDGTGETARRILQTEINRIQNAPGLEAFVELQVEREYKESLEREINTIEKSIKMFNKYKKGVVNSLNQELEECSNEGYINLLKKEMAEAFSESNSSKK